MTDSPHSWVGPAPRSPRAEAHMVAMRDGVRLATDVYLPDSGGPWPAVLARVPYDKCGLYTGMSLIAEGFMRAGYAFVAQDVRGKFRSEGERLPWINEPADGADTIAWLAGRSFCDGNVGMVGDSYYGFTQWAAASERPEALRAIVPRVASGVLDAVGFNHGAFALAGPIDWLSFAWIDEGVHVGEFDWAHRPLIDIVEASFGVRSEPMDRILARGQPWEWARFPGIVRRDRIDIPVLHWIGWWDNLRLGNFSHYRAMRVQEGAGPQHLVVDSTDHEMSKLYRQDRRLIDAIDAGNTGAVELFWERELQPAVAFLDQHVRGLPVAPAPAVRWHHGHVGWQSADRWPPPGTRPLELFLADAQRASASAQGGALAAERPPASAVSWVHDPGNLVPDPTPDPSGYNALRQPVDERLVQAREDVLTFSSAALREPLDLLGPARLLVSVAGTHGSLQLVAKLVDVAPDGSTLLLGEGARIVHARHYDRLVGLDLGDYGYRMRAGHVLRLEIASSRFPRYLPHPGTDESPWLAVGGRPTRHTLHAGGDHAARLALWVGAGIVEPGPDGQLRA